MTTKPTSPTLRDILKRAEDLLAKKNFPNPSLDAEVLLAHVLQETRAWLFAHLDQSILSKKLQKFERLLALRAQFSPIAYLVGTKSFYGRDFFVSRNVLVPRPETEILVERILKHRFRFLADIGTGSGAIAVTVACERPRVHVHATDISQKALTVARKNARVHQAKINFYAGSLLTPLIRKKISVDVLIANLPYLPKHIVDHNPFLHAEPRQALVGGKQGTEIIQKFLQQIPKLSRSPKKIFLEIDPTTVKKILPHISSTYRIQRIFHDQFVECSLNKN